MKESNRRSIIVLSIASIIPVATHFLVVSGEGLSPLEFGVVVLSMCIVVIDVLFAAGLALEWIEEVK
tara:strand:+ start:40 stop:240 length:201 start_codon:yes stop_codon:yes gene_type:complete